MYLKKILCENMGVISKVCIELDFNNDGTPKPLILVGKNGSGKSVLISNIVDSFYEFSAQAFVDTTQKNEMGEREFYKIISENQIQNQKEYMDAYLEYAGNSKIYKYAIKSGNRIFEAFCEENSIPIDNNLKWNDIDNDKKLTTDVEYFRGEFDKNTYCYFPPNRYEKPWWMNEKYVNKSLDENISLKSRNFGKLNKLITVTDITSDNLKWLLDIIVDSRAELTKTGEGKYIINGNIANIDLLSIARNNIETILSDIIGKEACFSLNHRNTFGSRFAIKSKENNQILVPTLDALSTGQSALFNIFSTIIRYSDSFDVMKSVNVGDITGIVVIDEIELHLHSDMQRDILPKLIKRFPKVQFIITSHSPLFLLGMQEQFGDDGFDIYEMPNGEKIGVELFSEFQNAYKYLSDTESHRMEIRQVIDNYNSNDVLIITEGSTDWKHMMRAFEKLKEDDEYKEVYKDLKFEFLKYEPKNSKKNADTKIEMGKDSLFEMCKSFAKVNRKNKIIFIADRDDKDINKNLMDSNKLYKKWGDSNVYSFIIPVPQHRLSTPDICIEHYYTDDEIKIEKTCEDGIVRRLYIGNEFDSDGFNHKENKVCKNINSCGKNKINIIEGSTKERVVLFNDCNERKVNYALPKMEFAEGALNHELPFNKLDYKNFHLIFDIIKEIIEDNQNN